MGARSRILSGLTVGVLAIAVTGCSGPTLQESLNPELGKADCKPASPAAGPDRNFEIMGTPIAEEASASGLFFQPDSEKPGPGERKFVVRVTGEGELSTELVSPAGDPVELAWGPEAHSGSNFVGAGDEWGLGLPLSEPGCWALTLTRGDEPTAAFWFEVQ